MDYPKLHGELEISKNGDEDGIFIGGTPEGLKSFAKLLIWLAGVNQEKINIAERQILNGVIMKTSIIIVSFAFIFTLSAFSEEQVPAAGRSTRETPVVLATRDALPSVVNIGTERLVSSSYSPWGDQYPFARLFRDYFAEQGETKTTSLGSGSIIDPAGLIITNCHVVSRASKIEILLEDGTVFTAIIVATDDLNDVALLKIVDCGDKKFKPIKFSEPGVLFLGEPVIAVGNPFGLGHSITCGVLSAIGRKATYQGKVIFSDIIQTDAAINPGNSGGPLINVEGDMIGMSVAMHKTAQGISFAIPLKRIENILGKWLIPERFSDVSLGIILGLGESNKGRCPIAIEEVVQKSPAWNAGLRPGDIVKGFEGRKDPAVIDILRTLWKLQSGNKIKIETDKGSFEIAVAGLQPMNGDEMASQKLGIGLQELTPQISAAMDYPFDGGLVVNDVKSKMKNIARGDMLFSLGDKPVNSFAEIPRALQNYHFGDKVPAVFGSVIKKGKKHYIMRKDVLLDFK